MKRNDSAYTVSTRSDYSPALKKLSLNLKLISALNYLEF